MKVYTKSGDKGETGLWGGKRVSKADLQVECYGTVDEANSCLGLARGFISSEAMKELILRLQYKLQILASEIASTPKGLLKLKETINKDDILQIERSIDLFWDKLPKLSEFILPGGTVKSGVLDLARTIVRRAERLVVALKQQQEVREEVLEYLNRLSDLLFVLARVEAEEDLVQVVKEKVMERLEGPSVEGISLKIARRLAAAAQSKAAEMGVPIVSSVVDKSGSLILLERQEDAILASIDISWKKAYTSAMVNMPTHVLADLGQPGQPLYGIESTNNGQMVIFGGGFPLNKGSKLCGAVGVSGGSVEQDMEIALAAVSAWKELTGD